MWAGGVYCTSTELLVKHTDTDDARRNLLCVSDISAHTILQFATDTFLKEYFPSVFKVLFLFILLCVNTRNNNNNNNWTCSHRPLYPRSFIAMFIK